MRAKNWFSKVYSGELTDTEYYNPEGVLEAYLDDEYGFVICATSGFTTALIRECELNGAHWIAVEHLEWVD